MDILDLADYALTQMPSGITLGEFKYMNTKSEAISTRNKSVNSISNTINRGLGIRILSNGAWGYSASSDLSKESVETTIKKAYSISETARKRNPEVSLTDEQVYVDKIENRIKINPFDVELDEKIEYLIDSAKAAENFPEIKFVNAFYRAQRDDLILYNTEGTKIEQGVTWNGIATMSVSRGNNDTQTGSFPADFFSTEGWEYVRDLNIPEIIEEFYQELVKLLYAPAMKPGNTTIILDPAQLGVQLHESCGHPSELDRSLGYEAAYAGTSFLRKELLDQDFQYGNELVNINADATIKGGLGSFSYDHEGVKGKNTPLIEQGKLVGFLTSRETASMIGLEHSGGTMRSELFDKSPLIRMTNIVFQPGEWGFEEMIEDTKDGYYLKSNRSWSIDDLRYNFQFACEFAYKIEKGKIIGLVKNPTYTGITDEFWNSVSAVGKKNHSQILGTPSCGKGEPGQTMYTGHGGPPVRFENIRVGIID